MINRHGEEEEETVGSLEELPPLSARLVLNYLEFEHLINNKTYVTFKEIIDGTGLELGLPETPLTYCVRGVC